MKKQLLWIALVLGGSTIFAQSKLDLSGHMLLQNYEMVKKGYDRSIFDSRVSELKNSRAEGGAMVSLIVKIKSGYTIEDLLVDELVTVVSSTQNMCVIETPIELVEKISQYDAVEYASVGYVQQPVMYFARNFGKINDIQSGTGLEQPYNGAGIVVGMMDQGMDPNHINFSVRGDVDESRVKAVYEYKGSNGVPTTIALTPDEIKAFTTDMTASSHATHVMGIAAGSYNGLGKYGLSGTVYDNGDIPYYGIATDADIVMCGGSLTDPNIIAGVEQVIEYAKSVGKPAAVNLSIGLILGSHDGKDAICQYMAELGKDAIICIAAGNDGGEKCAMQMSGGRTSSARSNNAVTFTYDTEASTPYTVQFWSNNSDEFAMDFVLYSSDTKKVVYSESIPNTGGKPLGIGGAEMDDSYIKDENFSKAFAGKSYVSFWSQNEAYNDRYCVQMQMLLNRGATSDFSLIPAVRITRTSGQSVSGYFYTPGNNGVGSFKVETGTGWDGLNWANTVASANGSISDMATADNLISVGAFTSSATFSVLEGGAYSYNGHTAVGEICEFSSYGTNPVTGEGFPLICAPGSAIVSSVSNYCDNGMLSATAGGNGRNNLWASMQGTSMACPFATGTMALWLQADPSLKVDEVKEIIQKTAQAYTGSDSDLKIRWGAGKLDALAGIKEVLERKNSGVQGVLADVADELIVTPVSDRCWNVSVASAAQVTVRMFNMQGIEVACVKAGGSEVNMDATHVAPGLYVLSVETPNTDRLTRRLLVK